MIGRRVGGWKDGQEEGKETVRRVQRSFTVNYRYLQTPKIVQRTNIYMLRVLVFQLSPLLLFLYTFSRNVAQVLPLPRLSVV